MYDETQMKIIDAAMNLVMERGYSSTTTKDIAKAAGINECTIFRKFKGKKEIILSAMELPEWNPCLKAQDFPVCGDVEQDLVSFAKTYMRKVTPQMVKVSIGLRTPELYGETAPGILKVPQTFKKVLLDYFLELQSQGRLKGMDAEVLAAQFLSMNFGFVFLDASFGKQLFGICKEPYIEDSVKVFIHGIGLK
ncbi:MAG: TetR/AcrR family transcriptional regulator [Lachnospiraceae bacterium]|nr:TetR/AcrR family transcriptional regulator [Lachnospiraceae bacterium]MDO5551265.1 TetR/AcrR family transcriptional regulator [Lachnospiraceae bacterium]